MGRGKGACESSRYNKQNHGRGGSQDNAMSNTMGGDGMPDAEVHIWLSLP